MINDALEHEVISEEFHQSAHAIRKFGNSGAHPSDAELTRMTKTQARIVLNVTVDLLIEVYDKQ
jgi:hypothetical protein